MRELKSSTEEYIKGAERIQCFLDFIYLFSEGRERNIDWSLLTHSQLEMRPAP